MEFFFEDEDKTWRGRMKDFFETLWWRVEDFIKDWIWPAYKFKYLVFNPQDVVKLTKLSKTSWCDKDEKMYQAVMELVKIFIEEENPEEHVLWYRDEEGNEVGHKYIKYDGSELLFPEYEGHWIMDMIKEIYNWYVEVEPELSHDRDTLLNFWGTYLYGQHKSVETESGLYRLDLIPESIPTEMSFFEGKDIDWTTIEKYCEGNRSNVLVKDFISIKMRDLEDKIYKKRQKMLHLAVEVRSYLWT